MQETAAREGIRALRDNMRARVADVIDETITIQQIPAPTFEEAERADYAAGRFREIGLQDVTLDETFTALGRLPGANPDAPALCISAHLDTVFPADTDLTIRRDGDSIHGPGIGDNSVGVASLIGLAAACAEIGYVPPVDIWFAANSGEEGLGDLCGIKGVIDRIGDRVGAAVIVEGMSLGWVYHRAVAVRRLRVTCTGEGGHSWANFGRPSAIHGLARLVAEITAIEPAQKPRTTYNVGVITGGRSVNTIADEAHFELDMRSLKPDALARLEARVRGLIDAARQEKLTFTADVIGDRPGGSIKRTHPLVRLGRAVLEEIGIKAKYGIGSTDANAWLARGFSAITVGITRGMNAHRLDEVLDTTMMPQGLQQIALLAAAAAEVLRRGDLA
jgi:acetylornithine deacetylase/succinyl-diaminopimelate desuccinylase-like protein